jgi:hypothetical protein
MPRILKIALLAVGLAAAGFLTYQTWRPSAEQPMPRPVVKGVLATPATAGEIVGQYYTGDGLGRRVELTLQGDGTYEAVSEGCAGRLGSIRGRWSLTSTRLAFIHPEDTNSAQYALKQTLANLEVQRFRGHWIFVPTGGDYRQYYEQFGVDRFSCFQNVKHLYGW